MNAPVLGALKDSPRHRRVTTFKEFSSRRIEGLARVTDQKLEILAVISLEEGRGNFRAFLDKCKQSYSFIRFWAMMNPDLEKTLKRHGFCGGFDVDDFGEMVDVMDWTRPT